MIDLLAKLYKKQLAKVKVAGTLSEWFPVKKGVRQGCVLCPYLFNMLADTVRPYVRSNNKIRVYNTLIYVDYNF